MDNFSATDKLLFCNFGMYLRDNECVSGLEKNRKKKKKKTFQHWLLLRGYLGDIFQTVCD